MNKDKVLGKISLDENEIHLLKEIEDDFDEIELYNSTEQITDSNLLIYNTTRTKWNYRLFAA